MLAPTQWTCSEQLDRGHADLAALLLHPAPDENTIPHLQVQISHQEAKTSVSRGEVLLVSMVLPFC